MNTDPIPPKLAQIKAARAAAASKPRSRLRPPSPSSVRMPTATDATASLPPPVRAQQTASALPPPNINAEPPSLPDAAASDARPTREELRARCRAKAARARGMPTERKLASATTSAMSSLAARLAAGAGTPEENAHMKDVQDMYTTCGGDLTKLLAGVGLPADLIPQVVRAASKLDDTHSPAAIAKASRDVVDTLLSAGFAPALASIIKPEKIK